MGEIFVNALEREASEVRLRESEQRYRNLVENSQGLICTHDMEGTLLSVNPAVAHLSGYQPSEMVGRNLREFLMPAVRPFFGAYLDRIRQEQIVSGLLRGLTKDGHERVWAYRNVRFEEAGQPAYVLGHAIDITERVRAEEALRETEARLRAVVANSPIVLFALDREGVLTLSEGKGLAALGLQAGDVVGKSVFDVYANVPQILENCRRALKGESFTSTMEVTGLTFEVVYVPLQDRKGVMTGVIGVATDNTEKNRLEMELLRASQISLLGELAAGLAHEIKNPLASIHGVVVRVRRGSGGTDDAYPYGVAIIEVEDTGRGIPDHSLGRIFNAFFTTKPRGTGLGLPAVRRIAEAHGGQVEVKSALGCGSIFTLSLPLSAQDLTNDRKNPRQKENPHRR